MQRLKKILHASLLSGVVWLSLGTSVVSAAAAFKPAATPAAPTAPTNPSYGQALEIAPPVIYLSGNPGQTISTQIYIRDISSGNLLVTGQANDFVANGEDGTPKVLLTQDSNNPYSMKSWVSIPSSLILVPHEIKTMLITFNIPMNASPGGHYAVIRFTGTPPSISNSGVSLSASLGSLVLLTVSGKISENLATSQFVVDHNGKVGTLFQNGPLNFTEIIKNTGNVHEEPQGTVTVTDMFGSKLAVLPVNTPPGNILPNSSRKFQEAMDKTVIGNKFLFGRYSAKLNLTYGAAKNTLVTTLSFWVIPYKLVGGVIIGIIALFFILRYLLKRYNRYILSRANGTNNHTNRQPPPPHQPKR